MTAKGTFIANPTVGHGPTVSLAVLSTQLARCRRFIVCVWGGGLGDGGLKTRNSDNGKAGGRKRNERYRQTLLTEYVEVLDWHAYVRVYRVFDWSRLTCAHDTFDAATLVLPATVCKRLDEDHGYTGVAASHG